MDEERLASELKGNTQRVYWCLLSSKNNVGVRQLQRKLGFSSPALAVYHLEKLVELGLVEKVHGEYHLAKIVDVGVLKQFIKLGGVIIPRHVLYASMFTTLFIFYLSQLKDLNFYSVFALIFGLLATGITWFETIRARRSKP
jgi:predicted DNA-binding transcriptional regulator